MTKRVNRIEFNPSTNEIIIFTNTNQQLIFDPDNVLASNLDASLTFVIDGGGAVPSTGLQGFLRVPFSCNIVSATLLADQTGSIVVDVFKCTYAQFNGGSTHPVSADKITSSTPPTISSSTKSEDTSLVSWTKTLEEDCILGFNVNSVSTIQRVTISLKVIRT